MALNCRALHLEGFFEFGKVFGTITGDEGHVFETNSTETGIIKTRLDRDNVAGRKFLLRIGADARRFVNLHADPVAGAMEESLHAAFVLTCFVTFAGKKLLHARVDLRGFFPVAHAIETDLLAALHGVIEPPHGFAGATFNHGTRDVAEVTCLL